MSKNTSGRFIWHELMTSDPKRSISFYGELFAWKSQEVDMGQAGKYTMFKAGDKDVGGMMQLDGKSGAPPHWLQYVTTLDVDDATKRAEKLGAKVLVPGTDIPNVGRFSLLADPQGAHISPFRGNEAAESADPPKPGTFCWDELLTKDAGAAVKFYESVFGWTHDEMDMGPMGTYYVLKRGDKPAGGVMTAQDPKQPPAWLSYIATDDVDASTKRAEGLKAKVLMSPADIPNIGRFSVLADPVGAVFALFKGK